MKNEMLRLKVEKVENGFIVYCGGYEYGEAASTRVAKSLEDAIKEGRVFYNQWAKEVTEYFKGKK